VLIILKEINLVAKNRHNPSFLLSDDNIEEMPSPCEIGGYILYLPDKFHKVFATCCGYHIEIDTKADHRYDATGLGRIHKFSIPSALGLSSPIVSKPNYILSCKPSLRNIAIGPGWGDENNIQYLSQISSEIKNVELKIIKEEIDEISFKLIYKGEFYKCDKIVESYKINKDGIEVEDFIKGDIKTLIVQIPLFETDGKIKTKIEMGNDFFKVKYKKYEYMVKCIEPKKPIVFIEPFSAPNRNGIYKVGCFKVNSYSIKYKISFSAI